MQGLVKTSTRVKRFVPHPETAKSTLETPLQAQYAARPVLKSERFDGLAHDARNVVSALQLYCQLLAEPGVLTPQHHHYARELQAISDTTLHLVEGLALAWRTVRPADGSQGDGPSRATAAEPGGAETVEDLGQEILRLRPLLAAIAGPRIELEVECLPCAGRTSLPHEDLTRALVNLVSNAVEALPAGGRIRITAQYGGGFSFIDSAGIPEATPRSVVIAVQDNGSGVPENIRERIFEAGVTTHEAAGDWPSVEHRGLGLSVVRSLIEAAGGKARLVASPVQGARFELEIPITYGT